MVAKLSAARKRKREANGKYTVEISFESRIRHYPDRPEVDLRVWP
jgi:hypothetical protein